MSVLVTLMIAKEIQKEQDRHKKKMAELRRKKKGPARRR